MSIDGLVINLDRKQYLRPLDMGLNSQIRSIENAPSLFHLAIARLLCGAWQGCRVAILEENAGTRETPDFALPSWETVCSMENGWTNILPEVVADLVVVRSALMNVLFGGQVDALVSTLVDYTRRLQGELDDPYNDIPVETLTRHLVSANMQMGRLRGLEMIPPRWADLVWTTHPVKSSGPVFHSLVTLSIDDDRRTIIPTDDALSLFVFYMQRSVRFEVTVEAKRGSVRVGLCRADCSIHSANAVDFDFETSEDFVLGTVALEVLVPRAPNGPDRDLPVPCFVSFVEVTTDGAPAVQP
jgi:hypothetical protein